MQQSVFMFVYQKTLPGWLLLRVRIPWCRRSLLELSCGQLPVEYWVNDLRGMPHRIVFCAWRRPLRLKLLSGQLSLWLYSMRAVQRRELLGCRGRFGLLFVSFGEQLRRGRPCLAVGVHVRHVLPVAVDTMLEVSRGVLPSERWFYKLRSLFSWAVFHIKYDIVCFRMLPRVL